MEITKPTEPRVEKPVDATEPVVVKTADNAIPYARFKEINDKLNATEEKLTKIQADKEDSHKKELEKQGEYKTLLSETELKLEAANIKAVEWDAYQEVTRKRLIEQFPEEDRDIYEGLPLEKLEKAVSKISGTKLSVDGSLPTEEAQSMGYPNLIAAANARRNDIIDDKEYGKIHKYFTNKLRR